MARWGYPNVLGERAWECGGGRGLEMARGWKTRACIGLLALLGGAAVGSLRGQGQEPPQAPGPVVGVQSTPGPGGMEAARPGEVYRQAMKPLDLVRSSLDNWSDAELGALASGMRTARLACDAVDIDKSGPDKAGPDKAGPVGKLTDGGAVSIATDEDQYDLIRLCALGQDWNQSLKAAKKYLAGGAVPHRTQAYALSVNAMVRLNDLDGAVGGAREMLQDVPYDAEVAYAMQFLKTYLTQSVDPKALTFATEEHGALVEALKSGSTLKSLHGEAVMGIGTLFESGMQLAFLERYAGDERGAERTCEELDAAVAKFEPVSAPDRQLIDAVRKQYGLLGHSLPEIDGQSISTATAAVKRFHNDAGFVTIVAIFPDYCPQCMKTMVDLTEFAAEHVAARVHAYGLAVREDMGAVLPESWKALKGTSTLAVKPDAVQMLGAVDYPFLVVADGHGVVYFDGTIPANAFVPNGYMEQVIGRIVGETAVVRNGPRNGTANGARNGGHSGGYNGSGARATPVVKKP